MIFPNFPRWDMLIPWWVHLWAAPWRWIAQLRPSPSVHLIPRSYAWDVWKLSMSPIEGHTFTTFTPWKHHISHQNEKLQVESYSYARLWHWQALLTSGRVQKGKVKDDDEDDDLLERWHSWSMVELSNARALIWLIKHIPGWLALWILFLHLSFECFLAFKRTIASPSGYAHNYFILFHLFLVELVLVSPPGLTSICLSPGS